MLTGEFEHYHGEAVNPKHLSLWEQCVAARVGTRRLQCARF
jgi:hypothetical protein